GLVVHVQEPAVGMQLEPPRARAAFQADVRRIERRHRAHVRVEAIAIDAIQPELGDVCEAAVFTEYDAVRARTWLARAERSAAVLVRVETFAQPAVSLDAVSGHRAAV